MFGGDAFIGHQQFARAKGALYQEGPAIGNSLARRYSTGGAFASYAGSCSILGRTVEAIGKDVAEWMPAPTRDARLGDQPITAAAGPAYRSATPRSRNADVSRCDAIH